MANVKQTQKMIPFITCEISLGQYVSELVFGVTKLGSKLILSNNQSRSTLWVLETCLIVGLLPFMIILITASLSSNTFNKASWREELTFEGIKTKLSKIINHSMRFLSCEVLHEPHAGTYTSLPVLYDSDSCFQELRRPDPINQVRGHHPPSILHPKRWFLILLNCAKLKFVSCTSNWLEQMFDFQKHTMFHLM